MIHYHPQFPVSTLNFFSILVESFVSDVFSEVYKKTLQLSLDGCTNILKLQTNDFQAFKLKMKCNFNMNRKTDYVQR